MSYQKCIFNKNQGGGNNATSDLKIELMINGTERIQRNAQQVFLTKHVVNIKYRPAGRKTANINVKKLNSSLKRGVYRPDSTYKTAKMIYQEYSH